MTDLEYLQLTLQLAAQGAALVSPNPMVGSVIVNNDHIVGRGYHRYDDVKHAEAWALEEAGPRARGATAYINLEPCCHRGEGKRTPPCVDALIAAGITRVVASIVDQNPAVNGLGFETLRRAGIAVTVGGAETDAQRLNEKYITYVTTRRPFVHLKMACSIDGRIATRTGDSKWITGEESRAASQALRHEYDAILVGASTVALDDPFLTDRTGFPRHRKLLRVVLDGSLRVPLSSHVVNSALQFPTLVFTERRKGSRESEKRGDALSAERALERAGVEVVEVSSIEGRLDVEEVLEELGRRQITSLLVEGGSEVAASFLDKSLVDKVTFFYGPKIIGGRNAIPAVGGDGALKLDSAITLDQVQVVRRGPDWEATGYPVKGSIN